MLINDAGRPQTPQLNAPTGASPSQALSSLTVASDAYQGGKRVRTAGVQKDWRSHLPGFARYAAVIIEWHVSGLFQSIGHWFSHPAKPPDAKTPQARAEATWQAAEQQLGLPGQKGLFRTAPGSPFHPADAWPQGQAIAATLDIAQLTGNYTPVDQTMKALSLYQHGNAYTPGILSKPGNAPRYYDDNAWIGLDFMQAYAQTGNKDYLNHAESLFSFLQQGQSKDGGLYWVESAKSMSRNTCSNGPAIEMALRLYQATHDPKYLSFAKSCQKFLDDHMRSPEGMYYDNLGDDGTLSKKFYTYNQGTPIGADVLFNKVTGDHTYLDKATQTANATLDYLAKNHGLWKESPVFNAIFFRNLMALDAVAPNPRYKQALNQYLDRAWSEARDPKTGLFSQGGIGHYDGPGGTIDQSAMAQMYALAAWPDKLRSAIA
jgi:rhamnogalacturonyl hydrolase YesR